MANKILVELGVDEQGRGEAALSRIKREIDGLSSATATTAKALSTEAQAYEQDLLKAGVAVARARVEAEKYQASLRDTATAQTEVAKAAEQSGITISRVYRDARKEIEATGKSATQLAEEARRSQEEAFKQRALATPPAPKRDDAAVRAAREQYVSPDEFEARKTSFGNFSARAAAQQAQREIALARQENLQLQNEVTLSSRLTGQMISAFVGSNIIGVAVAEVKELAASWVDTLKAQEAAHLELRNASIDYGTSIESNIKAVKELEQANRNALTAAQANRSFVASLSFASEAGRADESSALTQRAIDLAARRGIPQENVPALLERIQRGSPGALKELTGQDDIDALNRYASAQRKLVTELSETEKTAARMDVVLRSGAILQGEAERQTRTFTAQMDALKKDFEDSSWILGKADFGARQSYRAIQNYLNPPDPAPSEQSLTLATRGEETRNILAGIGQTLAEFDKRLDAGRVLAERNKAATAAKQAALEAKEEAEAQEKALQGVQRTTEGLYSFLSSHRGKSNPYVAIFSEAQQAAENFETTAKSLRASFGAAADDAIAKLEQLTKAKRDALAEDALSQRFDDRLKAQSLQQEIKALNAAPSAREQVKREVQETATTASQAARQGASIYQGAFSPGAFIGTDSPFAPKGAETEDEAKLRGLVSGVDQGRYVLNPATWAGQHFSFTDDEKYRALVNAKAAGRFVGDPARVLSHDAVTSQASSAVANAREAAQLIREMQAEAEAKGVDPLTAARLADQQILNRVKGSVSAEDLMSNPDLRNLVTGAMGRESDRLLNREDDARQFQMDDMRSRKELKESVDRLNQTIQKSGSTVKIEVRDDSRAAKTTVLGPGYGPGIR